MDRRRLSDEASKMSAEASGLSWDQEVLDSFVNEIYYKIAAQSARDPERAVHVASRIRKYADNIIALAGGDVGDHPLPAAMPRENTRQAVVDAVTDAGEVNGAAEEKPAVGRNMVSRFRELVILDYMNAETRAVTLHEVQSLVAKKGFTDSDKAVISQLHRLHQGQLIEKPNNAPGLYAITQGGRHHLAQLKTSYGERLEQWLSGETV